MIHLKLIVFRKSIKGSFDTLKVQYDELTRNFNKENDKSTGLQAENKKLGKTVKLLEERASTTERDLLKADELNGKVMREKWHELINFGCS